MGIYRFQIARNTEKSNPEDFLNGDEFDYEKVFR
jgi:hypothetical protein